MSVIARQEISAAASTVAGITCYPTFRQTTRPGDAMVRLDRIEYPDRFGGIGTYQVVILLAQDIATAEVWIDENLPALLEALAPTLSVRRAFPAELALDTGKTSALFIEGTREE